MKLLSQCFHLVWTNPEIDAYFCLDIFFRVQEFSIQFYQYRMEQTMMTSSGRIIAITSMSLKHAYGFFTTQKYNNSITSSLKFFSLSVKT